MNWRSACGFLQNYPPSPNFAQAHLPAVHENCGNHAGLLKLMPRFEVELKSLLPSLRSGGVLRSANLNFSRSSGFRVHARKRSEPILGKLGSVSFGGLSHQSVEESKLVSVPSNRSTGSLLWVLGPVALISSLIVPQFFIVSAIQDIFKNEVVAEILSSFSIEVIFYTGLAIFLRVTEHVQKPYLQFSPRSWSLITGLRGYLTSAFFAMGFKVVAPLIAVYVTWPVLKLTALVSVAPFLSGCLLQYVFERRLDSKGSSCWPLVPIIFEVYRIYQLTRATSFIEKLIYGMREAYMNPAVLDRTGALVSMIVTFRVLGLVSLWSLLTFLLRLFPSRPVAENY